MNMYNRYLYHGIEKGSALPNHKYTRREWRNGRWYYYYEDATTGKTDISIEKTKIERVVDKAAANTRRSIDQLVHNGSEFVKKMLSIDEEPRVERVDRPIGQNYTVDPTIGNEVKRR